MVIVPATVKSNRTRNTGGQMIKEVIKKARLSKSPNFEVKHKMTAPAVATYCTGKLSTKRQRIE